MYIIVEITKPNENILGAKEDLANYCEKYGDIRFVDVTDMPKQLKLKQN